MAIVRTATAADIDAVVDLWVRAAGPTRLPSDGGAVVRLLERDPGALLVAEKAGEIVGTLITGWDGWRCHLYRLAMDPRFRRRTIASRLLDAGRERARGLSARRLDALVSDDNAAAIAFWQDAGFDHDDEDRRWTLLL